MGTVWLGWIDGSLVILWKIIPVSSAFNNDSLDTSWRSWILVSTKCIFFFHKGVSIWLDSIFPISFIKTLRYYLQGSGSYTRQHSKLWSELLVQTQCSRCLWQGLYCCKANTTHNYPTWIMNTQTSNLMNLKIPQL